MKRTPEVDVLIFGQSAYLAWCATSADRRFSANRHLAVDAGTLSAILRTQKPELALLDCRDSGETRDTIMRCKRSNPLVQIIVLCGGTSKSKHCAFDENEVFATVAPDCDAIALMAILNNAMAVVKQLRKSLFLSERRHHSRQSPAHWLLQEQTTQADNKLEFAASLIRNILHTASHGPGVGAVLTYVDLLQMNKGGGALPDQTMLTALAENAQAARHWLAAFENILHGLGKKYPQESMGQPELQSAMEGAICATDAFRRIKGQTIELRAVAMNGHVSGSIEAITEILSELLLNAYKFSPDVSRVRMLTHDAREYVSLMVVNEIEKRQSGIFGIPPEYEERIFEPFFRMNNTWDDRFRDEKFGLGCGLTLAEHAAQQCGGRLYLYEVGMPQSTDGSRRIVAELMLPKLGES